MLSWGGVPYPGVGGLAAVGDGTLAAGGGAAAYCDGTLAECDESRFKGKEGWGALRRRGGSLAGSLRTLGEANLR